MADFNIDDSLKFADALYSGVQIVAEYMAKHSDMIETVLVKNETPQRDAAIKGLWFRARAWMQSLETLNHAKHFQAVSAANRALLEIAVDLVLLHRDKTNGNGWKIYQWGLSERMKAARQVVDYYQGAGRPIPEQHKAQESFYLNERAIVDHMRKTLWPVAGKPLRAEHPPRWTGKPNLFEDIKEAEAVYGDEIEEQLGCGLIEYYRTRYRQINWQIHSGIAGFWNVPSPGFEIAAGLALKDCADMAMLCTRIVLTDFGFREVLPELPDGWDEVRRMRLQIYGEKMGLKPED